MSEATVQTDPFNAIRREGDETRAKELGEALFRRGGFVLSRDFNREHDELVTTALLAGSKGKPLPTHRPDMDTRSVNEARLTHFFGEVIGRGMEIEGSNQPTESAIAYIRNLYGDYAFHITLVRLKGATKRFEAGPP